MTKTELIEKIASKHGCTKKSVNDIINYLTEEIIETVKNNDKIVLMGFGTFSRRNSPAKTITAFGKKQDIESSSNIKFKPSNALKEVFKN